MEQEKKKILFDATVLTSGCYSDSSRSGIYFCSINILKEFLRQQSINVGLFCNSERYYELKVLLKKEFNDIDIEIITDKKYYFLEYLVGKLLYKKRIAKKENKKLLKQLYALAVFFLQPLKKIINFFNTIKNEEKIKDYNIFFSPVFAIPKFLKKNTTLKKFVLLYDNIPIIFSEYYQAAKKNFWFYELLDSLNKDDYYFAISENTKKDFLEYKKELTNSQIKVTPIACAESFKPDKTNLRNVLEKYNIPQNKKYIFSLCTLEPRKNLTRAVKTFIKFIEKHQIENLVFVLGGGAWTDFINLLEKEVENIEKYKPYIIKAGYIDDKDLNTLYSGAQWFVYTSQYEGFGMPPLEAMSCGCPVITSNNSSLPEVVSDAGIMIDYDNEEQHIAAYEKYYFNQNLRNFYAQKGYVHSKSFSWEKCINLMLEKM